MSAEQVFWWLEAVHTPSQSRAASAISRGPREAAVVEGCFASPRVVIGADAFVADGATGATDVEEDGKAGRPWRCTPMEFPG